jgi:hypothetical protein
VTPRVDLERLGFSSSKITWISKNSLPLTITPRLVVVPDVISLPLPQGHLYLFTTIQNYSHFKQICNIRLYLQTLSRKVIERLPIPKKCRILKQNDYILLEPLYSGEPETGTTPLRPIFRGVHNLFFWSTIISDDLFHSELQGYREPGRGIAPWLLIYCI